MRIVVSAMALAVACVFATPTLAQELVTNGGFESGTLAPFTRASGGVPAPIFTTFPRTGTFHFGDYGEIADALTFQTLTTVPGTRYRVSAWVRKSSAVVGPEARIALGANAPVTCATLTETYALCTADFTALTATDDVRLYTRAPGGTGIALIDDVSVVLAPPPSIPTLSEWAMIALSGLMAGAALVQIHRRRVMPLRGRG